VYSLSCDARGFWQLAGGFEGSVEFFDLSSALEYGRRDAGAKEAGIEIRAGGLYIFVHQDEGWPSRIVA
jgi:hypothetical protein